MKTSVLEIRLWHTKFVAWQVCACVFIEETAARKWKNDANMQENFWTLSPGWPGQLTLYLMSGVPATRQLHSRGKLLLKIIFNTWLTYRFVAFGRPRRFWSSWVMYQNTMAGLITVNLHLLIPILYLNSIVSNKINLPLLNTTFSTTFAVVDNWYVLFVRTYGHRTKEQYMFCVCVCVWRNLAFTAWHFILMKLIRC